ncbi:methylated-DNA--[protein]-cysteine S-methyltransferase [Flavobacterium sp. RHBU_3]|uniref:methylated-DNA--[protein]-cysteine S-methyltransferase n=1 Tax=Flavobacterium sp. RHBU_3 TaxID=3391184 RepID=UPI0039853A03
METVKAYFKTPLGIAIIEGNDEGICRISILDETPEEIAAEVPAALRAAVMELEEYFSGSRQEFTFTLNPQGTDFQKKVWQELVNIPYGKTTSYQELSIKLGDVKAIRAVASANGKNTLWVVVPCHRVIGSDGSLTGYAGGLWRKKWLLEHETPPIQQSLF